MDLYFPGIGIWIPDETLVWAPAQVKQVRSDGILEIGDADGQTRIIDTKSELVYLRNDSAFGKSEACIGKVKTVLPSPESASREPVSGSEPATPANANKQGKECDDLTQLVCLHEPAVLHNLQQRFFMDAIYTFTGPILIAVNPFKPMGDMYSEQNLRKFITAKQNPPHVFATANQAFKGLCDKKRSQTVLISGESGAGKTETTKFVMKFLALAGAGDERVSKIEKRVLESNPLLEAFGNARTLRNDNSSRFGKFIELQFQPQTSKSSKVKGNSKAKEKTHMRLRGAHIQSYLLEKIRVTDQQEGERNFHIFYQLIAACLASRNGKNAQAASTTANNAASATTPYGNILKPFSSRSTSEEMPILYRFERRSIVNSANRASYIEASTTSDSNTDNVSNKEEPSKKRCVSRGGVRPPDSGKKCSVSNISPPNSAGKPDPEDKCSTAGRFKTPNARIYQDTASSERRGREARDKRNSLAKKQMRPQTARPPKPEGKNSVSRSNSAATARMPSSAKKGSRAATPITVETLEKGAKFDGEKKSPDCETKKPVDDTKTEEETTAVDSPAQDESTTELPSSSSAEEACSGPPGTTMSVSCLADESGAAEESQTEDITPKSMKSTSEKSRQNESITGENSSSKIFASPSDEQNVSRKAAITPNPNNATRQPASSSNIRMGGKRIFASPPTSNIKTAGKNEDLTIDLSKFGTPFEFLTKSSCFTLKHACDKEEFEHTLHAMLTIGMKSVEIEQILALLAAVLHLGNLKFVNHHGERMNKESFGSENEQDLDGRHLDSRLEHHPSGLSSGLGSGVNSSKEAGKLSSQNSETNQASSERVTVVRDSTLTILTSLLGLKDETALAHALCHKVIDCRDERVMSDLRWEQVLDSRDALARHLYGLLFQDIVRRTNKSILSNEEGSPMKKVSQSLLDAKDLYISEKIHQERGRVSCGVLDIFGFECFKTNSFEQLCINYTNERLQQYFNDFVFRIEERLYRSEGIPWDVLDFPDNTQVVDLLQEKPVGIFCILDEECMVPKGSDQGFVNKLFKHFKGRHPKFSHIRTSQTSFIVKHFAGEVLYQKEGFLDKNKDILNSDLIECMQTSENDYLRQLFSFEEVATAAQVPGSTDPSMVLRTSSYFTGNAGGPGGAGNRPSSNNTFAIESRTSTNSLGGRRTSKQTKKVTVSAEFRDQLSNLLDTIRGTDPHFIRCIKSNSSNEPGIFERTLVTEQLRYSGVIQVIQISRSGYPVRIKHNELWMDYRLLLTREYRMGIERNRTTYDKVRLMLDFCEKNLDGFVRVISTEELIRLEGKDLSKTPTKGGKRKKWKLTENKDPTKAASYQAQPDQKHQQSGAMTYNFVLGKTLVFFKKNAFGRLHAARLQRRTEACVFLQSNIRMRTYRQRYRIIRNAVIQIQAIRRGILVREWFRVAVHEWRAATKIQARFRCWFLHVAYRRLLKDAATMNRLIRGAFVRKKVKAYRAHLAREKERERRRQEKEEKAAKKRELLAKQQAAALKDAQARQEALLLANQQAEEEQDGEPTETSTNLNETPAMGETQEDEENPNNSTVSNPKLLKNVGLPGFMPRPLQFNFFAVNPSESVSNDSSAPMIQAGNRAIDQMKSTVENIMTGKFKMNAPNSPAKAGLPGGLPNQPTSSQVVPQSGGSSLIPEFGNGVTGSVVPPVVQPTPRRTESRRTESFVPQTARSQLRQAQGTVTPQMPASSSNVVSCRSVSTAKRKGTGSRNATGKTTGTDVTRGNTSALNTPRNLNLDEPRDLNLNEVVVGGSSSSSSKTAHIKSESTKQKKESKSELKHSESKLDGNTSITKKKKTEKDSKKEKKEERTKDREERTKDRAESKKDKDESKRNREGSKKDREHKHDRYESKKGRDASKKHKHDLDDKKEKDDSKKKKDKEEKSGSKKPKNRDRSSQPQDMKRTEIERSSKTERGGKSTDVTTHRNAAHAGADAEAAGGSKCGVPKDGASVGGLAAKHGGGGSSIADSKDYVNATQIGEFGECSNFTMKNDQGKISLPQTPDQASREILSDQRKGEILPESSETFLQESKRHTHSASQPQGHTRGVSGTGILPGTCTPSMLNLPPGKIFHGSVPSSVLPTGNSTPGGNKGLVLSKGLGGLRSGNQASLPPAKSSGTPQVPQGSHTFGPGVPQFVKNAAARVSSNSVGQQQQQQQQQVISGMQAQMQQRISGNTQMSGSNTQQQAQLSGNSQQQAQQQRLSRNQNLPLTRESGHSNVPQNQHRISNNSQQQQVWISSNSHQQQTARASLSSHANMHAPTNIPIPMQSNLMSLVSPVMSRRSDLTMNPNTANALSQDRNSTQQPSVRQPQQSGVRQHVSQQGFLGQHQGGAGQHQGMPAQQQVYPGPPLVKRPGQSHQAHGLQAHIPPGHATLSGAFTRPSHTSRGDSAITSSFTYNPVRRPDGAC